jgi:hypothetical protein
VRRQDPQRLPHLLPGRRVPPGRVAQGWRQGLCARLRAPRTPSPWSLPQHHPETFRTPRIWGPRRRLHGTRADVARGPPRRPWSWSHQLQAREPRFGSSHVGRGKGRWVAGEVGRQGGGRELARGGGEPAAAMEGDGMPPPSITRARSETGSRKTNPRSVGREQGERVFFHGRR